MFLEFRVWKDLVPSNAVLVLHVSFAFLGEYETACIPEWYIHVCVCVSTCEWHLTSRRM